MKSFKEILPQIKTFIFDVDGVLTDGSIILSNGDLLRTLNSKDGYALQYAAKLGYTIICITGGDSMEVKNRLEKSGVTEVVLSAANKLNTYKKIAVKYNLDYTEVLYMGDDIPDLQLMNLVAMPTAPSDAVTEVLKAAHYVSPKAGGKGCVRDVIEQTLRVQDKWLLPEAMEW